MLTAALYVLSLCLTQNLINFSPFLVEGGVVMERRISLLSGCCFIAVYKPAQTGLYEKWKWKTWWSSFKNGTPKRTAAYYYLKYCCFNGDTKVNRFKKHMMVFKSCSCKCKMRGKTKKSCSIRDLSMFKSRRFAKGSVKHQGTKPSSK